MIIRNYKQDDKEQLNSVAVKAFTQFKDQYNDWDRIYSAVGKMSSLAASSDLIVAEDCGEIIGGVALIPPGGSSSGYFDPTWASIRMLVVSPEQRGKGVGKKLTVECINRAIKSGVKVVSLHTSPIMEVALSMYLRMGFVKVKNIEAICGVEYAVYKLEVEGNNQVS